MLQSNGHAPPHGAMACPGWEECNGHGRRSGSILAGQQQRGDAAIPFGDDPELQVRRDPVGREQTILAGLQRGVVQLPIVVAQVAPVAMEMAARKGARVKPALSDQIVDADGHDQLPR